MTRYSASFALGLLFSYFVYFNIGPSLSFIKLILFIGFIFTCLLFLNRHDNFIKKVLYHSIVFVVAFCFGVGYVNFSSQKSALLDNYSGEVLVKDVNIKNNNTQVFVYAKNIDKNLVFNIFSLKKTDIAPGDKIFVEGKLNDEVTVYPEKSKDEWESFDYAQYLKSKDIDYVLSLNKSIKSISHETTLNGLSFKIRVFILKGFDKVMDNDKAGVLLAMVLGDQSGLTQEVKDDFQKSGLSHVLVFSGFNFTILISVFSILVQKFSKKTKLTLVSIFIFIIFCLVPFSAPTVRAGVFVSYALLANLFNKNYNVKTILWLFIIGYFLLNPLSVLSDISFHLSVIATLSVIYGGELLEKWTDNQVKRYFGLLLIVFTATCPYVLYVFGGVSLFSMFANALVLPIVSILSVIGIVLIITVLVFPWLSFIIGFIANFLVGIVLFLTKFFSYYYISIKAYPVSLSFIVLYYILLVCLYYIAFLSLKIKNNAV